MKEQQQRKKRGRPQKFHDADRESTSTTIKKEALRLFAANGFDVTSTVAIASAANVAQSVLHYHFKTKDKLWKEVITDLFEKVNQEFPADFSVAEGEDDIDTMRRIIRRHMQVSSVYPEMARIIIIESSYNTERLDWLCERYFQSTFRNFDQVLDAARDQGLIGNTPNFLLTNIVYAAGSIIFAVAPMINKVYGVDVTNPMQREMAVEACLETLLYGIAGRQNRPDHKSKNLQTDKDN